MRKIVQIERSFLALLGGLFLFALAAPLARAQDYPTRPITIVVPFTPGGTTDILARMIGQRLEVRLGQSFLIENKPGAGTTLGAGQAAPDGYTLLMATSTTLAINKTLYRKLPYDPPEGFYAEGRARPVRIVRPSKDPASRAHHHPSCGSQCDAAIANAISVPTVNVVSAAVLGGSD